MDTVWSFEAQKHVGNIKLEKMTIIEKWEKLPTSFNVIKGTHNIWADDKCWLAIAMELYERYPERFSLLFTVGEESWLIWARDFIEDHWEELEKLHYCVIADRKWSWDIIWSDNGYCTVDFEKKVAGIIAPYGYLPEFWVLCDADVLNKHLNCINLSCGYYNAHTDREYVVTDEMENCMEAIAYLTGNFFERMEPLDDAWRLFYDQDAWLTNYYGPQRLAGPWLPSSTPKPKDLISIYGNIMYIEEPMTIITELGNEIFFPEGEYTIRLSKPPVLSNALPREEDDDLWPYHSYK